MRFGSIINPTRKKLGVSKDDKNKTPARKVGVIVNPDTKRISWRYQETIDDRRDEQQDTGGIEH